MQAQPPGGGRREAAWADLALCTLILAQSDPQVQTPAPLPRHTTLSHNSQRSGKPKTRNQLELGLSTTRARPDSSPLAPLAHAVAARNAVLAAAVLFGGHALTPGHDRGPAGGLQLRHRVRHQWRSTLSSCAVIYSIVVLQIKLAGRSAIAPVAGPQNSAPARTLETSQGLSPLPKQPVARVRCPTRLRAGRNRCRLNHLEEEEERQPWLTSRSAH